MRACIWRKVGGGWKEDWQTLPNTCKPRTTSVEEEEEREGARSGKTKTVVKKGRTRRRKKGKRAEG